MFLMIKFYIATINMLCLERKFFSKEYKKDHLLKWSFFYFKKQQAIIELSLNKRCKDRL